MALGDGAALFCVLKEKATPLEATLASDLKVNEMLPAPKMGPILEATRWLARPSMATLRLSQQFSVRKIANETYNVRRMGF